MREARRAIRVGSHSLIGSGSSLARSPDSAPDPGEWVSVCGLWDARPGGRRTALTGTCRTCENKG
jgi:hypothetical protein